jgi:catechol 2,3-dioxygenase-like lactoylglutathione lyase family enzyme
MTTSAPPFELRGFNHIALTSSDMQKTVDFYEGILGFPLVKTLEGTGPNGKHQHFFFQVTENDGVAFFWFEDPPPAAQPGVTGAPWRFTDENGRPTRGIAGIAAKDAMHHMSFDVPLESIDEYRDALIAAGVEVTDIVRHTDGPEGDDQECIRSLYFRDPDGFMLEFSAMTRDLTETDARHSPARAEDAAARLQSGKVAVTV